MKRLVNNAPNTANLLPTQYGCSSWREYWEMNGGDKTNLHNYMQLRRVGLGLGKLVQVQVYRCPSCGKSFAWDGMAPDCFDGCHVNITGDESRHLYITPLCHTCNQRDISISIDENMLIPVANNQ